MTKICWAELGSCARSGFAGAFSKFRLLTINFYPAYTLFLTGSKSIQHN